MKTAVIICNGTFPKKEYPSYIIKSADYIVCCDGALRTYLRNCTRLFGQIRRPDAVVGDMDSIPASLAKEYADICVKVSEQETNDQSKAFHYIIENYPEVDTIYIVGAGGKREDHTIGNLSLLMEYAKEMKATGREDLNIQAISDWCTIFAVTDSCSFDVGEGRGVSIFTADNTLAIKSEGLRWQTEGVVLDNWWKASLNKASSDTVKLTFSHPSIALIVLD